MPVEKPFQRIKRVVVPTEGIDLSSPNDTPKSPAKAARLQNLTVDSDGSLTLRPGLVNKYAGALVAGKTPVHSIRRITDQSGAWSMIYGVQNGLYVERSGNVGVISAVSGAVTSFSNWNPFTIIPWRPNQAAKSYAYIYDDTDQCKIEVNSTTTKSIGLPMPWSPPRPELASRKWGIVDKVDTAADWTAAGQISNGAPKVDVTRVSTFFDNVIYDTAAASGWQTINPTDLTDIGDGTLLKVTVPGPATDYMVVEEVNNGTNTALDIQAIEHHTNPLTAPRDFATVQAEVATGKLKTNAMVVFDDGGANEEYTRVREVIRGIDDYDSFVYHVTTIVHTDGESLKVVPSFRATNDTGSALLLNPNPVTSSAVRSESTGLGVGYFTKDVSAAPLDMDHFLTSTGAVKSAYPAFIDEDYFHISLNASDWGNVEQVRVMFDVSDKTFTKDFYWYAIEQSELVLAAKGKRTPSDVREVLRGRNQIRGSFGPDEVGLNPRWAHIRYGVPDPLVEEAIEENFDPTPSDVVGNGENVWAEIFWKKGWMQRSGNDKAKDWKSVKAIRVEFKFLAASPTTLVAFGSLTQLGGGGPDVGEEGMPYYYRYRFRDSSTGVVSDYSPPSLAGVNARRNNVEVKIYGNQTTSYVDKIDVERFGGLQNGWYYAGSVDDPGDGSAVTFTDKLSDIAIARNAAISNRRIAQPWVQAGAPLSGTGATVAGSVINLAGTTVSTDILPGTLITVDGVACTIRRPLTSNYLPTPGDTCSKFELHQSIGYRSNVGWQIPNPNYSRQAIGRVFGPFANCMFACDGIFVRWTEGNDPDATHETNRTEVTDPTDVTMGGCIYNDQAYIFTTKRLFALEGDPVRGFTFREVPGARGLYAPWALASGQSMAWLSKDGIYEAYGGMPQNITTEDLAPLFPLEGRVGTNTNDVKSPKLDSTEQKYLRLNYLDDGSLVFTYRDSVGGYYHLRYERMKRRWFPYKYKKDLTHFYALEGDGTTGVVAGGADSPDAKVYTVGGSTDPTTDDGTGFDCVMRHFCEDFGDPRSRKYLGDLVVDANPASHTTGILAQLYRDNDSTSTALGNITGASRTQKRFDLSSGNGLRARNYSLDLSWTTEASKKQRLYLHEMALLNRPETVGLRATAYESAGYNGDKFMQGIRLYADTFNVAKTVRIEYDGGNLGASFDITHNGERNEPYSFDTPFIARLVRIATADTDDWELYDYEYVYNPEPPAAEEWWIQLTGLDLPGYKHIYQIRPALAAPANVTMTVYADNYTTPYSTQTITNTGGANYTLMQRPTKVLPAQKFKLFAAKFTSTQPFRLYLRDTEVLVKEWGSDGDYQLVRLFGDVHRTEGARI